MADCIFLNTSGNEYQELKSEKFENEDKFQELLQKCPQIIERTLSTEEKPVKLIFITRELGIASQENGGAQWFLDHLFIDQDSIPTLVEVKRKGDTRLRREVVGQMMEYAANAMFYTNVENIRSTYENRFSSKEEAAEALVEFGNDVKDAEEYWLKVKNNFSLGKMRLLFVADDFPASLRNIIEFLNGQMKSAEVLGIEIRHFRTAASTEMYAADLIGNTKEANETKGTSTVTVDEDFFFERVKNSAGEKALLTCKKICSQIEKIGCSIVWGTGTSQPGFSVKYKGKREHTLSHIACYTKAVKIHVPLDNKKELHFTDDALREELLIKYNQIPGVNIDLASKNNWPSFNCLCLEDVN